MGTLTQDLRFGVRTLLRAPGFALISILTLALGIGATSVVFSFVGAILDSATPVAGMERRAAVWSHNRTQGETKNVVSIEDFVEWKRRQQSFDRFSATRRGAVNLSGGSGEPVRAGAMFVTADFFDVLGQHPVLGRPFRADEEAPGAQRVAILSNDIWRDRFDRRADILGHEILIDGRATTIVGVLPANDFASDLLLPLVIDPSSATYREHALFVWTRLRDGVTLEQASAEMKGIGDELERIFPDTHRGWGVNTRPLQEEFVGPQARLA